MGFLGLNGMDNRFLHWLLNDDIVSAVIEFESGGSESHYLTAGKFDFEPGYRMDWYVLDVAYHANKVGYTLKHIVGTKDLNCDALGEVGNTNVGKRAMMMLAMFSRD